MIVLAKITSTSAEAVNNKAIGVITLTHSESCLHALDYLSGHTTGSPSRVTTTSKKIQVGPPVEEFGGTRRDGYEKAKVLISNLPIMAVGLGGYALISFLF